MGPPPSWSIRKPAPKIGGIFSKRPTLWSRAFPAVSESDLIRDIKPGAVVIDCSTEGNLHPDVAERAAYISAHDNHLGQITTALALYNTALCALWQCGMKA